MPPRVFLDWSRPFLPALAEWLLKGAAASPAPDLSSTVVILPTAAAGRRLRELLAGLTLETGVLSPQIITPEVVLTWGKTADLPIAGRGEEIAAWASVLTELNLEEWRPLFPINPVAQDIRWATGAAADLLKLRRTLEEGGRNLSMAAQELGTDHPEAARWLALGRLEQLTVARLIGGGWQDSLTVRLAAAHHPRLPEDTTRVVLAGVPDSIRLVRLALEGLAANAAAITVVIHAPEAVAASFDDWGRPRPEVWNQREIKLPKGHGSISLTTRPEDAAQVLLESLRTTGDAAGGWAIGTADPEVSAPLRRQAAAVSVEVYDPDGQPLMEHEISWLMKILTKLLRGGTWSAAGQLLRLPEGLAAACRAARTTAHLQALEDWDRFQAERLPTTLSQAAPLAAQWADADYQQRLDHATSAEAVLPSALPGLIGWMQREVALFKQRPLPEAMADFLETLYGSRTFAEAISRRNFTDALTAWDEAIETVERGARVFLPGLPPADRLELATSLLQEKRLYAAHSDDAQALHGWLELPWQEAPDLVIAGMNEGMVPDSVLGDAWLPDSVRALLDLKTNDTRLARDSYLLTTMIESRHEGGSVKLLAGRMTAGGDPLKPSRLLLRCRPEDLPHRALHLFPRELDAPSDRRPSPPWHRAWQLRVTPPRPDSKIFQRISVTAFGDYLKCPFRFYLKHVLKMEPIDPAVAELDARTVGNFFHNTMEDFHKNEALRDSTDARAITAFLHEAFEIRAEESYGESLAVPVVMQLEVIRNCLAKAAEIHAAESEAGWRFKEVELVFPKLVMMQGTEVRGRIDLIQHHPKYGYRILDYKTSSTAVKPEEAHLKTVKRKLDQEALASGPCGGFAVLEHEGSVRHWQNLQLPLYAKIMAAHYDVEQVGVGYINLPRAVSEAGLAMWENLDQSLLESAWQCAEGVIRQIQRGIFWPPAGKVKYDDFASLIFQGAESSFDPTALNRVAAMIASGEFQPTLSAP